MFKKTLTTIITLSILPVNSMNLPKTITLHDAIFISNQTGVKKILNQHCDLETLDERGQTPLLNAANSGQLHIAQLILLAGANPNAAVNGRTALHYAVMQSKLDFTLSLILAGALPSVVDAENGFTPLHYAAKQNEGLITTVLCQQGADVTLPCARGITPLEVALDHESLESFASLLINDSNRADDLLLKALAMNSMKCVNLLILNGIKISKQTTDTQERITKLLNNQQSQLFRIMLFSTMDNFKNVLATLESQNFAELDTALLLAYAQDLLEHTVVLEHSMKQKSIPLADIYLRALKSAVACHNTPVCKVLLQKINNLHSEYVDSYFLNLAAQLGHHDIVNLILKHQNQSKTLKHAVSSERTFAIEALLNAGAQINEAENFFNTPKSKTVSNHKKAYFTALRNRFTMHREAVNNPSSDSYLSLLCKDVRVSIISPMVKTQSPKEIKV